MLVCKKGGGLGENGCLFDFYCLITYEIEKQIRKVFYFITFAMVYCLLVLLEKEMPFLEETHRTVRISLVVMVTFSLAEKELQNDTGQEEKAIGDARWEQTQEGHVGALYHEQFALKTNLQERLDHTNFRFLLWRALAKFPERVEPRSRELSPLFLRFIK